MAHDGEERKDEGVQRHKTSVEFDRAKLVLERREEGDLADDGQYACAGESFANVGLGEAQATEGDTGVAEEDEEGLRGVECAFRKRAGVLTSSATVCSARSVCGGESARCLARKRTTHITGEHGEDGWSQEV